MNQLQKVLHELKGIVARHRPGETLSLPASLSTVDINGQRIAYVAGGAESDPAIPPVVLLHGFGGFFMDWPRVMAPLARHTRVYALDLPGWGFSEANGQTKTLEEEVGLVQEFLSRLGLNRVILCGLSYGGGLAWAMAAMNVPRVSRVILLNPMPPHPLRYMHSPIYRGIFFLNRSELAGRIGLNLLTKSQYKIICRENLLNDRLLDTFYLDLAFLVMKQPKMNAQLRAHVIGAKATDWASWEHRLAGIRAPVSILQGCQDRIFSVESARYLHRMIPTSELIEIADCGHAMVFDQHRKVADFIIRHLHHRESHGANQKDLWRPHS